MSEFSNDNHDINVNQKNVHPVIGRPEVRPSSSLSHLWPEAQLICALSEGGGVASSLIPVSYNDTS